MAGSPVDGGTLPPAWDGGGDEAGEGDSGSADDAQALSDAQADAQADAPADAQVDAQPDAQRMALYEQRFGAYVDLYPALKPVMHRLQSS